MGFDSGNRQLPRDLEIARNDIEKYAREFGLDTFNVIFEMVDYEEMNSLAALGGFPVRYPHWRFGMDYDQLSKGYEWGLQKIYEMVINTDPSYAYLLKSNCITDQKTVMAHVMGHVDFFKNNDWFSKTNRKMLDSMANHAVRIRDYMDDYGQDPVEEYVDHCLAIENLIDVFLPFVVKKREEKEEITRSLKSAKDSKSAAQTGKIKALTNNRDYMDRYMNPPEFLEEQKKLKQDAAKQSRRNPAEPQKDVLAFLLEYAPLEEWEWDVLSIIRDEAYYFAPQWQTKMMNEGWASYWHSKIMTTRALKDSEIIDFADQHSGTMAMAPGRINPYKIGIELFRDIEERWDKGRFGLEWDRCDDMVVKSKWDTKAGLGRQKIFEVRKVCNDITFMDEYLTEEFVERWKLYTYAFNRRTNQYEIAERDFKKIKEKLLFQLGNRGQPVIYVVDGNFENKGELLLEHKHQGLDLDVKWARETMRSLHALWRRSVSLMTLVEGQKKCFTYHAGEFTERVL